MDLVAEGRHRAVVSPVLTEEGKLPVQFGEAKTGTKQVLINFQIIGDDDPDVGRQVPWWGYFTDKTYQRTLESLRYCGFTGEDLADALNQELDNEVSITVEHNEREDGKVNARVAWVNQAGGGGVKLEQPMAKSDLQRFAAQMRGRLKGIPEVAGKKAERGTGRPAARPSPSAPPPDLDAPPPDDDIPF